MEARCDRADHQALARLKHIRRPRTRRGWLITIVASGAILALKLTLGLGVLALVVHLLTH
jgi:hypothetical protein